MNPVVAETRARRRWVGFISMFFVAQGALWTWAITTVSTDSSHAVVANYDARALDWDAQRARMRASAALGWDARVELDGDAVTVRIADADGLPVAADAARLVAFHNAEASHRQAIVLHTVATGVFQGRASIHRPGHWTLELEVDRGDDAFTLTRTFQLD